VRQELVALASQLRLDQLRQAASEELGAILERHYQALGGLDRVRSLRSLAAVGTLEVANQELPFRIVRRQPGLFRIDLETPAGALVEAADGQAAWRADPSVEGGSGEYLSGPEGAALRRGAPLFGPLIRPRSAGEQLVYKGVRPVAGRDHHVIEVSSTDGARQLVYLDAQTFLESKTAALDPQGEVMAEIVTELRELDGYRLPARQTVRSRRGTLVYRFESYQLNPDLDLALFDIVSARPPI
jgi:outer membrane lipoprotein-sorting protein